MVGYLWSLNYGNDHIPIDRIVSNGYTLCWAAKWNGSKRVMFDSIWQSGMEDMLKNIHDLLSEADAVIHYNGSRFDIPTLNKEFINHRFKPPPPYKQIDLLQVARKKFRFESNKLDFVAQFLGVGKKLPHKGMDLWRGCMAGSAADQKVMERYNKQDVKILEKVYQRMLPWIPHHPNHALYSIRPRLACKNCGSTRVQQRGYERTSAQVYKRFQCSDCGSWGRDRTNVTLNKETVMA